MQDNSLAKTMPYAIFLHVLLIFGVGFGIKSTSNIKNATLLDITLVNTHSEIEPEKADFIAQANQEASGTTNLKNRPTSIMASQSLDAPDAHAPIESRKSTPNTPPLLRPLILTTKGETFKRSPKLEEQPKEPEPTPERNENSEETSEEARLAAEIAEREANYSKLPKVRYLNSSNAKSAVEAAYIDAWAKKIERIGTTNFPAEAIRLNQSGKLIVETILNHQGSIVDSRIHTSSGSRLLDNAALRIIKIASPYPPLPENVRESFDQLQITRTFIFETGNRGLSTQ